MKIALEWWMEWMYLIYGFSVWSPSIYMHLTHSIFIYEELGVSKGRMMKRVWEESQDGTCMFLDTAGSNAVDQLLFSSSDEEVCTDLDVKRSRAVKTLLPSLPCGSQTYISELSGREYRGRHLINTTSAQDWTCKYKTFLCIWNHIVCTNKRK